MNKIDNSISETYFTLVLKNNTMKFICCKLLYFLLFISNFNDFLMYMHQNDFRYLSLT